MSSLIGKWKIILMHAIMLLLFGFTALSHAAEWKGVDEAVVEKIASEHGRRAKPPLLDPGTGDLLLFAFLAAGVVAGFVAGYYWRELTKKVDR